MEFEFATAGRIVFGRGAANRLGVEAAKLGRRAIVVTGRDQNRAGPLIELLEQNGLETFAFSVRGEPAVEDALEGAELARARKCDLAVSIGGGSAVDAGKAVAALITNSGALLDYLEVIGEGKAIDRPPAPHIAVPTTAGTGAEVTRNSVLRSARHGVKVSMRSPMLLPTVAMVDPELNVSMPPGVTAATGMDALTQLIEAYVSKRMNPLVDGVSTEGVRLAARSLERAYRNGGDMQARESMSLASLFGGLALANAGLGAVHGFAGPIGGMFAAAHGAVCAALLPHVMEANIAALEARAPDSEALSKYAALARNLTGNGRAVAHDGVSWVKKLVEALDISPLAALGIGSGHFPSIVEKSKRASSMRGNPIDLTEGELTDILMKAL